MAGGSPQRWLGVSVGGATVGGVTCCLPRRDARFPHQEKKGVGGSQPPWRDSSLLRWVADLAFLGRQLSLMAKEGDRFVDLSLHPCALVTSVSCRF